jgi:hypothetical protein
MTYVNPAVPVIARILDTRLPVGNAGIGFEHSDGRSYLEVNHRSAGSWTVSRREGHRYQVRHPAQHGKALGPLRGFGSVTDTAVYLADRADLAATTERSLDLLTR